MIILPVPKKIEIRKEFLTLNSIRVTGDSLSKRAEYELKQALKDAGIPLSDKGTAVEFRIDSAIKTQGYKITVLQSGIIVCHADEYGALYAAQTLIQIIKQTGKKIAHINIEDWPDFAVRGLMLDISRNKVPKVATLKKLIDYLAALKINQFQLYIEGMSFEYESFKKYFPNEGQVLTASDIRELDAYCKERLIEFVPNQNCFGHMTEWLVENEFNALAECPQGFACDWNAQGSPPSTLNPLLSESEEFIEKLCGDLLPNFTSEKFNIGGDEPFELGMGASREACEKLGRGRVYMDFMSKVFALSAKYGKKIMMWGDVVAEHPECIPMLPPNVTALEWGYHATAFNEKKCTRCRDNNISYYVCPGTSLWNTVTGKTNNMLANIKGAAKHGSENGAGGLLLTDWGDGGTCQQFSVTLMPYAVGAAYSWNASANQDEDIKGYMNLLFGDKNKLIGQILFDIGNYYKLADKEDCNGTKLFKMLYVQQTDNINFGTNYEPLSSCTDFTPLSTAEFERTLSYLSECKERLNKVCMTCKDSKFAMREIVWSLDYLIHGCKLGIYRTDYSRRKEEAFIELKNELEFLVGEYQSIWLARNKTSGMKRSMLRMKALLRKYRALVN